MFPKSQHGTIDDEGTDQRSQSQKFIETARAIGCDESEAAFAERIKKLISAPIKKAPAKPKKAKPSK